MSDVLDYYKGIIDEAELSKERAAVDGLKLKNKLSVLIVDDCPLTRASYRRLLIRLGINNFQEAKTGREAVDLCQSGEIFDLILMDLVMPVMKGPQATKMLRQMGVSSVIFGVTATSRGPETEAFMDSGLNDWIEKPLTLLALVDILRDVDNLER
ncbi:hypothetical protein IFM89_003594 [Coptis chinensis]|uniref:Response regulatory domain-containing protein n=1 Tax=Coptis chinensis TaxID=261450 RepID=A0A835HXC8_9MAGN|nr:hypothetical protein IFM89_003594 [Coptis chinensis]